MAIKKKRKGLRYWSKEYLIVVYKYTHMWKFITMMHTYSELCLDV